MNKAILWLAFFLQTLNVKSYAQIQNFYGGQIDNSICLNSSSFSYDSLVINMISRIMNKVGAKNRFIIANCYSVNNCQATIRNDRPYIIYNESFLNKIKFYSFTEEDIPTTEEEWSTLTILAHEIGHHINNHLTNPLPSNTPAQNELEADEFAGHMLALLGAPLLKAEQAYYNSYVPIDAGFTHPSRASRIYSFEKGYSDVRPVVISRPSISGKINSIRAEHNVSVGDATGMKIHIDLDINNMKGIKGKAVAYFYYGSGAILKDFNGQYNTTTGQVCTHQEFTPGYDNCKYSDLTMFIPISELHMSQGKFELKFQVQIFEYTDPNSPKWVASSDYVSFTYDSGQ